MSLTMPKRRALLAGLLLLASASFSSAASCATYTNCSSCINNGAINDCAWCVDDGTCRDPVASKDCSVLDNSTSRIVSIQVGNGDVAPQRTTVELRQGVPLTLSFKVKLPAGRPINFYYLFDSSSSMTDDLNNVVNLARNLESTLVSICGSDDVACVKLQMGNFIDKPFNRINEGLRVYPFWPGLGYEDGEFHTRDDVNFTRAVEATIQTGRVIANSDDPESSFEAIMQAIMCTNWANNDRQNILLLTTDNVAQTSGSYLTPRSTYPTNGEKRLDYIGRYSILLSGRAEDRCYYNRTTYPELAPDARAAVIGNGSVVTDSPSAAAIKAALLKHNIVPVIAAAGAPDSLGFWKAFIDYLEFGQFGQLSSDYSNIQELVTEAYRSLALTVQLLPVDTGRQRVLFVKEVDPAIVNAEPGQTYTMNVVLEATAETPNDISAVDDATNPPLELQVLGIGRVQVKVLARTCNCEASPEQVENGKIVCGVATCAPGYSGARCQCTAANLDAECPSDGNALQCSGRGSCQCGLCICANATGAACECPAGKALCAVASDGSACGGKDKGDCVCGQCQCKAGWTGASCECPANSACPVFNGTVCSGRGACVQDPLSVCGAQCQCNDGYLGPACECDQGCDSTCNVENGLGQCLTSGEQCGICACAEGYTPESGCRCRSGEAEACPAVNGVVCNGQGACECGQCVCQGGWAGKDCSCSPFPCNDNCNVPNGACECGQCRCMDGYQGPTCACSSGASCPIDFSVSEEPCGGQTRGSCSMEAGQCGQCVCYEGYAGPACNCLAQACPAGANGLPCSGNGECDACGACTCKAGYAGADCSCDIAANPCPADCSNRGTCLYTETQCGVCACQGGGDDFEGAGIFGGPACECNLLGCPAVNGKECGEHGAGCDSCTGQCLCNAGWMQPSAQDGCICRDDTTACMDTIGLVCGDHGQCNNGTCGCLCRKGWTGPTCSTCDTAALATVTLPEGALCNGTYPAPYDGYQCTESACLPHCLAATSCDQCSELADTGCGWCGATQTCSDAYTAMMTCGSGGGYNESCGGAGGTEVIAIVAGAVAAGLALVVLALLAFKCWRMRLDTKEWAAFTKANQEMAQVSRPNPLYRSQTTERLNPLYDGAGGQ